MYIFSAVLKMILQKWKRFLIFLLIAVFVGGVGTTAAKSLMYSGRLTDPLHIIIVNEDDSAEANIFLSILEDIETYKDIIVFSYESREEAVRILEENKGAAAFIIPETFVDDVKSGANRPFYVMVNSMKPISQKLIEYFANAFTELLAASQSGVYAALDYTYETDPENYSSMFYTANLKFLDIALNREAMIKEHQVSVVTDISRYYISAFWVFFNLTAMLLFFDILSDNFNRQMLKYLKAEKLSSALLSISMTFAVFCILLLINLCVAAGTWFVLDVNFNVHVLLAGVLILFLISALTVFVFSLIKSTSAACIMVSIAALFGLFISGGIIPVDFFSPQLQSVSQFSLQYICRESLNSGSQIYALPFISLILIGVSIKAQKEGA